VAVDISRFTSGWVTNCRRVSVCI